jgi:hypothetical protein
MAIYDRSITTVRRLLGKYGPQTANWIQVTPATPDNAKPWEATSSTITSAYVDMVLTSPFRDQQFVSYVAKSEVPEGCIVGLMGPQIFTPKINDSVEIAGETLKVESLDRVAPNGDIILWLVTLKR